MMGKINSEQKKWSLILYNKVYSRQTPVKKLIQQQKNGVFGAAEATFDMYSTNVSATKYNTIRSNQGYNTITILYAIQCKIVKHLY